MLTAVDTSVLLDVFGADATFGPRSKEALKRCFSQGGVVACDAVWAEIASVFPSARAAETAMEGLGVAFSPLDRGAARDAGTVFRLYRASGGKRGRVVADFLIGAHARAQADQLLTRDRGFYRAYFRGLRIVDPAAKAT